MKFQTLYFLFVANSVALKSFYAYADQQFCANKNGESIGLAGWKEDKIESTGSNTILLERKGGDGCPCSYVSLAAVLELRFTEILPNGNSLNHFSLFRQIFNVLLKLMGKL